jgi:hypothetical protein
MSTQGLVATRVTTRPFFVAAETLSFDALFDTLGSFKRSNQGKKYEFKIVELVARPHRRSPHASKVGKMRNIYLVGKALPEHKARHRTPFPSGALTDLVALDPRHGVFPNLVMTPLFATVMAFYEVGDHENVARLLSQAAEILKDHTPRRLNALSKPKDGKSKLETATIGLLATLDPQRDLWLVFKHSTAFALISYLLTGKEEFTEDELKCYGALFLQKAAAASNGTLLFRKNLNLNTQVGLLFRLFAEEDADGCGPSMFIRKAVEEMAPTKDAEMVVEKLRCFVPLLHNDAYDKAPFGLIQNRFMACWDIPPSAPNHDAPPTDPYWRFIGKAIKRRLLDSAKCSQGQP